MAFPPMFSQKKTRTVPCPTLLYCMRAETGKKPSRQTVLFTAVSLPKQRSNFGSTPAVSKTCVPDFFQTAAQSFPKRAEPQERHVFSIPTDKLPAESFCRLPTVPPQTVRSVCRCGAEPQRFPALQNRPQKNLKKFPRPSNTKKIPFPAQSHPFLRNRPKNTKKASYPQ